MARIDPAIELYERGLGHVRDGEIDAALEVARRLETMHFTGAFEVAGLAHSARGDHAEAVRALERGVEHGPKVWVLWQLLGNERSALGLFDAALTAYEHAFACPGADVDSLRLNQAIVRHRQGRAEECLRLLEEVRARGLVAWRNAYRARALHALGRLEEAEASARSAIDLGMVLAPEQELRPAHCDSLAALVLTLRHAQGDDADALRAHAIQLHPATGKGHALFDRLRELCGSRSAAARRLRLMLRGTPQRGAVRGAAGFYTTYEVIADDADEGLSFVRPFLDGTGLASLTIEEAEDLGAAPEEPQGVVSGGGATYFR